MMEAEHDDGADKATDQAKEQMTGDWVKYTETERTKRPTHKQIDHELPNWLGDVCETADQNQEPKLVCVARKIIESKVHYRAGQKIKQRGKRIGSM